MSTSLEPEHSAMQAQVEKKKITAEELWDLGPEYENYELDDGELVAMTPPGEMHGYVAVELASRLWGFAKQHRSGRVYVETGFRLSDYTVRGPDISFVRTERLGEVRERHVPGPPDLAVEILSPHDYEHPGDVLRKVSRYLDAGTSLVWVLEPRARRAVIYRPRTFVEIIGSDGTLLGEAVLPGFACRLADLFPETSADPQETA
jgi:Uma2 family endonuclease